MSDEMKVNDHYMEFITWYLTKRMRNELSMKEDEELVTKWYVNHMNDQELHVEH